ncbi:MAG: DUF1653 domain-containing protein [Candidatus Moranbacteria bacterium]|nr:DUF1653 domain-containing protein [Candidatus Moranbacteria bacterium]
MQTGIYQHYKGKQYLVLGSALLEDSLTPAIIYQALYDEYTLWIREEKLFEEHLTLPEYSYTGPRFRFIRTWTEEDAKKYPKALSPFPLNEIPH